MYTLDCNYISDKFEFISDLIDYATINGVDPNLEILKNGQPTTEMIIDYIQF